MLVWLAAITAWLLPLWAAVAARRRGERVNKELAARAYRITLKGPVRVLLLRTALWAGAACLTGVFLHIYQGWPLQRVAEITALAARARVHRVVRARGVVGADPRRGPRSGCSPRARRSSGSTTATSAGSCSSR